MRKISKKDYYHIIFHLPFENDNKYSIVDSSIHYLIVEELLFNIVNRYEAIIYPWRLHRMFIKKKTNEFKFKFYCSKWTFNFIRNKVLSNYSMQELLNKRIIKRVEYYKYPYGTNEIGSDNDISWDYFIKEIWPYYICGVSKSWVYMIHKIFDKVKKENYLNNCHLYPLENRLKYYEKVKNEIEWSWINYGNHAFFHHANALFGYKKIRFKRFKKEVKLKIKFFSKYKEGYIQF